MGQKKDRVLEILFRLVIGSEISVAELANEYEVSTKSISRDINEIKNFIADHRDLLSNAELKYSNSSKKYYLELPYFLDSDEMFALVKVLIGARGFTKNQTLEIIGKLKRFTTKQDQNVINKLISNEVYHFNEVKHDCKDVIDNLWKLTSCIDKHKEITVSYYKMNRDYVERRVRPLAITFTDYYFYLIGYQECSGKEKKCGDVSGDKASSWDIRYYRVDRIVGIVEHRTEFDVKDKNKFDEGDLMSKIQFMFPGKTRHIRFEFSGPSVQAILDKIPTAKVVEIKNGIHIIEADVFGSGINMYLLSQGSWVKALAPAEFVEEMKEEIEKMRGRYK